MNIPHEKSRVTVLDSLVDVNNVLATVHASITLANSPVIVKAYPHSLLESLAAGKPVLVSRAIPMADYVAETGCGIVVEDMSPETILESIEGMAREYARLQKAAQEVGQRDFSLRAMISSYNKVYTNIIEKIG